jgi:hypothetical protein
MFDVLVELVRFAVVIAVGVVGGRWLFARDARVGWVVSALCLVVGAAVAVIGLRDPGTVDESGAVHETGLYVFSVGFTVMVFAGVLAAAGAVVRRRAAADE